MSEKIQLRLGMSVAERIEYMRQEGIAYTINGKKIESMTRLWGKGPEGVRCGDCVQFVTQNYHDGRFFKCRLYGITRGAGTDWRKKWPACGKFTER